MVKKLFGGIKEYFGNSVNSRLFVLGLVVVLMFAALVQRIFVLQIVQGQGFVDRYSLRTLRVRDVSGTRGNIYDRNGKLLAFNTLSYAITLEDSGSYPNNTVKNRLLNEELYHLIHMIEDSGEEVINDLPITYEGNGNFSFQLEGTRLQRFRADVYGRSFIEDLTYNRDLGYDEGAATARQVIDFLRMGSGPNNRRAGLRVEGVDEREPSNPDRDYFAPNWEDAFKIVSIRYGLARNSFQRFLSITIAEGVSDVTVARIKENSYRFTGVDIAEVTERVYNDPWYFSHILGYTGQISTEELEGLLEDNPDSGYTARDIIGKAGIEQYMETSLQGGKGRETFYVDNVGRIQEMLEQTQASSGRDVYLSIDRDLQEAIYKLLEKEIAGIVHNNIINARTFTPASGSASDIRIPIYDVYVQLIGNNVIDIRRFGREDATEIEQAVFGIFQGKQESTMAWLMEQLRSESPRNQGDLTVEQQDYMNYVLSMLNNRSIFNASAVDREDTIATDWRNGRTSLSAYLRQGIARDWVDIAGFETQGRYSDTGEIYEALLAFVESTLQGDNSFHKIMYRYLVMSDQIRASQLCLLLFDQGVLPPDEASYSALSRGSLGAFSFLMNKIQNIEITPAQLALDPCTGSSAIINPQNGELLALVTYPGFDNNRLANHMDSAYYRGLLDDQSLPLFSNVTQQATAPGSSFKMVSAAAGLTEGTISTGTQFRCTGSFPYLDQEPHCWLRSGHGQQNVSQAIQNSCNVFFYNVGFNLSTAGGNYFEERGINALARYAQMFGFGERTGVEIPESLSRTATLLPVPAAIGQSNNNVTTISLARYVTAVANQGNVYDLTLLDKMTDSSGDIVEDYNPTLNHTITEVSSSSWNAIQLGMRNMASDHSALRTFPAAIGMAGKTGTAQQIDTRPNHALFVGYAPTARTPEVAIATRIAYGYTSANAASVSRNILDYYFGNADLETILSGETNSSTANVISD